MYENRRKEKVKACIAIFFITIAILTAGITIMKYHVEGEKNTPFIISKITAVSTAEGVENTPAEEKWNLSIFQNNDIYISIEKNKNYNKEAIIESVDIKNIKLLQEPQVGKIKTYMPNSLDGRLFSYDSNFEIKEDKLSYRGANKTNSKSLEIGNQGGTIVIRFSNSELGNYVSNDDEEIKHDGTILTKTNKKLEDLKFTVNFDIVINMKNKSYKTNVTLDLPCEKNLIEEGTTNKEITEGFTLKRI